LCPEKEKALDSRFHRKNFGAPGLQGLPAFRPCLISKAWNIILGNGGRAGSIKVRWNIIRGRVLLKSCKGMGAEPAKNGRGGKGKIGYSTYDATVR